MRRITIGLVAGLLVLLGAFPAWGKPTTAGPKKANISISSQTVTEDDNDVDAFTIVRGGDKKCGYTVTFTVTEGSADTPEDYAVNTSSATIDAGSTSESVPVTVEDDALADDDETFTVQLQSVSPLAGCTVAVALGTQPATITITDNDDDDEDGVLNGVDNCPDDANADQADLDGDDEGDACDADVDITGTYSGTSNNPAPSFSGTTTLTGADPAYNGSIVGGSHATPGCFSLTGSVTLDYGSAGTVTGTVDSATSSVCQTADPNDDPDTYDLVLNLDVASGTADFATATGDFSFVGTQSPADTTTSVRQSTGTLSGTITL